MTEEREAHLIRMVRTLRCEDEIEGFRKQLARQGEAPSALVERERAVKRGK